MVWKSKNKSGMEKWYTENFGSVRPLPGIHDKGQILELLVCEEENF